MGEKGVIRRLGFLFCAFAFALLDIIFTWNCFMCSGMYSSYPGENMGPVEEEDWSNVDLGLMSGPNMLEVGIGGLGDDLGNSIGRLNGD